ncbi:MAG: YwiC-like family protein [Chloroflexi bacterium]|nr:YwiC-like family protein [Chloroflexota bacterium]
MTTPSTSLFRKHIALPQQHGSWALWLGPYVIGIGVGGTFKIELLWLTLASLGGFLLLQPLTVLIKVIAKRKPKTDLASSIFWSILYSLLALITLTQLLITNYYFLYLALAALPVLVWQLILVMRREERGQMGIELVGSGVLALAAPAAYWIAKDGMNLTGWILWILCWMQSAGAIVYIYLRLEHRRLTEMPHAPDRFTMAKRALLYNTFNVVAVIAVAAFNLIPPLVIIPFLVMVIETIYGALIKPGIGAKPVIIGVRQLVITVIFVILMIGAYQL